MKLVRNGMMYDESPHEGFLFGITTYHNKIIHCSESNNLPYSYQVNISDNKGSSL